MKISRVWAMISLVLPAVTGMTLAGETLYNGIELPDQWPPAYKRSPREPMPVPYLTNPPAVIPIDVGRQLLVDDFLIAFKNYNCHRIWLTESDLVFNRAVLNKSIGIGKIMVELFSAAISANV